MPSPTEIMLAPQFDGLAAVLRAIVSELETDQSGIRQKLARAAATDIRSRMKDANRDAARDVMLATVAITCGGPIGSLAGN
jgi:hypothetical protein